MSAASVLADANLALGGCPSPFSPGEIKDCATLINRSFANTSEEESGPRR
jgi:hypothetical protein